MRPVAAPPHFLTNCYECGRPLDTSRETVTADLHGPAWVAYYCAKCAERMERDERQ